MLSAKTKDRIGKVATALLVILLFLVFAEPSSGEESFEVARIASSFLNQDLSWARNALLAPAIVGVYISLETLFID